MQIISILQADSKLIVTELEQNKPPIIGVSIWLLFTVAGYGFATVQTIHKTIISEKIRRILSSRLISFIVPVITLFSLLFRKASINISNMLDFAVFTSRRYFIFAVVGIYFELCQSRRLAKDPQDRVVRNCKPFLNIVT